MQNNHLKRICVNCGSSSGFRQEYRETARRLGTLLAASDLELVYGGASIGLMGETADAVLQNGGRVIGIIPSFFAGRLAHTNLTALHVVETMHERKQMMFELSDAFIALPGGLGTAEELFELLTWAQIGHHEKPCGLLNVCGYYDKLIDFVDHAVSQRFVRPEHRNMILVDDRPEGLLNQFREYRAPRVEKWLASQPEKEE